MARVIIIFIVNFTLINVAGASELLVNQLGYLPDGDKKAYWVNPSADKVTLIALANNSLTSSLQISKPKSISAEKSLSTIDFSNVSRPGWYQLEGGGTRSTPFQISDLVYHGLGQRLVKALYLQRSGTAIENMETGMSRPISHINDGVIYRSDSFNKAGTPLDVTGGWYDAGDYGKYVATTTITVARLLDAYSQAPTLFNSENKGGSSLAPLVAEAVYGLQWLAKMQREDGAVYRKVSGAKWPDKVTPWQDTQVRYIYGVSTPETAKFAATMAFASRALKDQAPKLSRDYLKFALHAWDYLKRQPEQYIDWQQGDDSGSGPYIKNAEDHEPTLDTDIDDRLWALAELYLTTQNSTYLDHFKRLYDEQFVAIFEWKNPALMGISHLIENTTGEFREQLVADLQAIATQYLEQAGAEPFAIANQNFIWGSNKMTAEAGVLMAWADMSLQTNAYRSAVQSQIDYLLGANAFNLSFVTNTGTYAVRNLHHLYRIATGISLPGFMVGGPNESAQAGVAPKGKGMLSYVDSDKSYAVNEFAIDYNASLIGLLAIHHGYFN
jgi:endoglucanase